jgi:6-phosphogluconolactonase (cycloisomerase 2 family)
MMTYRTLALAVAIRRPRLSLAQLLAAVTLLLMPALTIRPAAAQLATGAVYTMTNATDGNRVVFYRRADDGTLSLVGSYATGGSGTGGGLENQGGLILSSDGRFLFVVNAGSNDITSYTVSPQGILRLADRVPSGGTRPVSLTQFGNRLFVLNAGTPNNLTGFTISDAGRLTPIPNSTRPLTADQTAPAQIQFNPEGSLLVVSERGPDILAVYAVGPEGIGTSFIPHAAAADFPFGMAFGRNGRLIVSEAVPGTPNGSSVSSYVLSPDGELRIVTKSAPTFQTTACWVVITNDDRYTYVSNTGSGSITGFRIQDDGSLAILNADGITARTGAGSRPLDMALSADSRSLYVLNEGLSSVQGFRINDDGSLTPLNSAGGLPRGANGLAAR